MSDAKSQLWDAALDFNRVVAPLLAEWLPPGEYIPVEGDQSPAGRAVDVVGGVDGWYVSGSTRLQGIAHRVQYGSVPFESFTVRARLPSGNPTELEKRLEALKRAEEHFVVPHYTIQAYLERRRTGKLLLALMVRTADLFNFIVEHPERIQPRTNPADGTEFIVVWAADLREAGLDVRVWMDEDLRVQLRDGQAIIPSAEEWEEIEADAGLEETGRRRLRQAALTLAAKQFAAELRAGLHVSPPNAPAKELAQEVIGRAENILERFQQEGLTGLPPPACDYCDPFGADLFPNSICGACGSLPEER